ncbi:YheC/YheD family protein [Azospirillum lipoferum]|uniref:YheC/YheD family protein n=1 Tax=Azospirillum lipoferum TaxID=193 RepID=UPI001395E2BE|nr:YheC/YheD family protein [Azospirillum lipoferum]
MIRIGFISYQNQPHDLFPKPRLRALLAEAALQGAELVLLDRSSWDRRQGLIAGERWTPAGWSSGWFSLPDVVVVKSGADDDWQELDGWIRRSRPVIADSGLDKLAFHELLCGSSLLPHAIPTVGIPPDAIDATLMAVFLEHGSAVVKPVDGRRGFGIQFIHRENGDGETGSGNTWQVQHAGGTIRGTLSEIVDHVRARIAGRLRYRRYLVQRFIHSVAVDGRSADIRVHVQRRADGEWGVTRAYVRLAEAGRFLTNISQGGYQGPIDGFLSVRRNAAEAAELGNRIVALAMEIAKLVDATKPLPLSELGIDLALDERDRLWAIEVNAFPQSSLHEHARAEHMIGYAMAVARGTTGHERLAADRAP